MVSSAVPLSDIQLNASPIALSTDTITPPVHSASGHKKFFQNQSNIGFAFSITLLTTDIAPDKILRKAGTTSFIAHVKSGERTFSTNHNNPSPTFIAKGANAFHSSSKAALILSQSILDIVVEIISISFGKPSPSTHLPTGFRKSL